MRLAVTAGQGSSAIGNRTARIFMSIARVRDLSVKALSLLLTLVHLLLDNGFYLNNNINYVKRAEGEAIQEMKKKKKKNCWCKK